jgi:hypothetical protein
LVLPEGVSGHVGSLRMHAPPRWSAPTTYTDLRTAGEAGSSVEGATAAISSLRPHVKGATARGRPSEHGSQRTPDLAGGRRPASHPRRHASLLATPRSRPAVLPPRSPCALPTLRARALGSGAARRRGGPSVRPLSDPGPAPLRRSRPGDRSTRRASSRDWRDPADRRPAAASVRPRRAAWRRSCERCGR